MLIGKRGSNGNDRLILVSSGVHSFGNFIGVAGNESVFAMAGYSVIRHAGTAVDFYFIAENNICCLIINVKPRAKAE